MKTQKHGVSHPGFYPTNRACCRFFLQLIPSKNGDVVVGASFFETPGWCFGVPTIEMGILANHRLIPAPPNISRLRILMPVIIGWNRRSRSKPPSKVVFLEQSMQYFAAKNQERMVAWCGERLLFGWWVVNDINATLHHHIEDVMALIWFNVTNLTNPLFGLRGKHVWPGTTLKLNHKTCNKTQFFKCWIFHASFIYIVFKVVEPPTSLKEGLLRYLCWFMLAHLTSSI